MEVEPEEGYEERGVGGEGGEAAPGGDHLGEGGEVEGCGWVGAVEVLGGLVVNMYVFLNTSMYVCMYRVRGRGGERLRRTSKFAIVATAPTNSSEKYPPGLCTIFKLISRIASVLCLNLSIPKSHIFSSTSIP